MFTKRKYKESPKKIWILMSIFHWKIFFRDEVENNKQGMLNFLFKILLLNFYPDNLEHIQFDPRQGYYQSSCLQKSGLPLWNKSCDLVGLGLITNCEESVMTALDLNFFQDWIRTAISTDIMKKRKWRKSKVLKDIFLNDLKTASMSCPCR